MSAYLRFSPLIRPLRPRVISFLNLLIKSMRFVEAFIVLTYFFRDKFRSFSADTTTLAPVERPLRLRVSSMYRRAMLASPVSVSPNSSRSSSFCGRQNGSSSIRSQCEKASCGEVAAPDVFLSSCRGKGVVLEGGTSTNGEGR